MAPFANSTSVRQVLDKLFPEQGIHKLIFAYTEDFPSKVIVKEVLTAVLSGLKCCECGIPALNGKPCFDHDCGDRYELYCPECMPFCCSNCNTCIHESIDRIDRCEQCREPLCDDCGRCYGYNLNINDICSESCAKDYSEENYEPMEIYIKEDCVKDYIKKEYLPQFTLNSILTFYLFHLAYGQIHPYRHKA